MNIERILAGEDIRTVLLSEAAPRLTRDQVAQLDVDAIIPDQKDRDRANGLAWNKAGGKREFHGNGAPWTTEAAKMAKLITDPYKLVRRAKAVAAKWGTDDYAGENVWYPFMDRLREMGFTDAQVRAIAYYTE